LRAYSSEQKKRTQKDALFILTLTVLITALFSPALLGKTVFSYGSDDGTMLLYPLRVLFAQGESFWTNRLFCGFPLFAEPHMALFYPLNWIFFKLLPAEIAFSYLIVFELFLASLFTYLFARLMGLKEIPSLISALSFSLIGFLPSYLGNATVIHSSVWLPAVFYFLELSVKKKCFTFSLLAGLFLSFQILGGFPQMAFITFLGAFVYYFSRLKQETKESQKPLEKREVFLRIILFLVFFFFALGFSAVQIIPTLELTHFSARESGLSFAKATEGSWSPANLLTFIFPYFFKGWPAQIGVPGLNYLGLFPFVFVLFSLIEKGKKEVKIFWGLTFFALFFALGFFNPFYRLIYFLPGFQFFRVPSRFLLISHFSLSLLAAFGLSFFLENFEAQKAKKAAKILTASLILIFLTLFLLGVFLNFAKPALMKLGKAYVKKSFYRQPYHPYPLKNYYTRLENFYRQAQESLNIASPKIFLPALLSFLALLIIWLKVKERAKSQTLEKIILLLVISDLILFFYQGNLFPTFKRETFLKKPKSSQILLQDKAIFRIYSYPHWEYRTSRLNQAVEKGLYEMPFNFFRSSLQPNLNLIEGLDSLSGYLGLFPERLARIINLWEMEGNLSDKERLDLLSQRYLKLLGWLNVKYILVKSSLDSPNLKKIYENQEVKIYQNKHFQPRFFLVPHYQVLKEKEIIRRVTSPDFNPLQKVVLERLPAWKAYQPFQNFSLRLIKYRPTEMKLKANLDGGGFLLITNSFYPGWQAKINGKESPIYRANYAFQAVFLPRGKNLVELKFESRTLKTALTLSLLVYFLAIALIFLENGPKKSKNKK